MNGDESTLYSCSLCGLFAPAGDLLVINGANACRGCVNATHEAITKHRPKDCRWWTQEKEGWKTSRERSSGAVLLPKAVYLECCRQLGEDAPKRQKAPN